MDIGNQRPSKAIIRMKRLEGEMKEITMGLYKLIVIRVVIKQVTGWGLVWLSMIGVP